MAAKAQDRFEEFSSVLGDLFRDYNCPLCGGMVDYLKVTKDRAGAVQFVIGCDESEDHIHEISTYV